MTSITSASFELFADYVLEQLIDVENAQTVAVKTMHFAARFENNLSNFHAEFIDESNLIVLWNPNNECKSLNGVLTPDNVHQIANANLIVPKLWHDPNTGRYILQLKEAVIEGVNEADRFVAYTATI